ncbi:twinkle protein-like protein [Dinothrombium tinctorium]|uniref:Twinkle protein-like protein n=1 Tax=Dinothrombium tinctorium TaxID=1965070 RepID=A0A3S3NQI4_9ACAR|nr:twinkle protein-like protein [Dinothrombium tinctorium]RWS09998.1 twinkle protein-like protein [Dinothrombium tinctorium]
MRRVRLYTNVSLECIRRHFATAAKFHCCNSNQTIARNEAFSEKTKQNGLKAEKNIVRSSSLRREVYEELINVEKVAGIKWRRFPAITKLLKGHRRSELTVFTGNTGSGKTTFLSEYSLDLCTQGVRTLWGNFELKNVRLMKLMLNQFAQLPLNKHIEQFDEYADKFEKLPMFFMKFHGEQSFDYVVDTMKYAVENYNIEHVIIDNLQFMIGNTRISKIDRFEYQDMVIGNCRKFATNNNCHVTLVIHPRKETTEELNINSIFGGGKASQEADNVLILQTKWSTNFKFQKYIHVCKNRYDGDLGLIPISYSKETHGFGVNLRSKKGPNLPKANETIIKFDLNDKQSDVESENEVTVRTALN